MSSRGRSHHESQRLSGRDVVRFKTWRKAETDINTVSLNGTLAVLQRFLRFCETIEAVEEDLADRVPLPNVPPDEEMRTDVPEDDAVEGIRAYYRRFEYASRQHVQLELVAEVGIRLGALRAIDLEDLVVDDAVIYLSHRPETSDEYGTPLKNGADGERIINISPALVELIEAYVAHNRHDLVDEHGRYPLFTTAEGRVSTTTVRRESREGAGQPRGMSASPQTSERSERWKWTRRNFYKLSRPCEYDPDCPHGREVARCEATRNGGSFVSFVAQHAPVAEVGDHDAVRRGRA